MNNIVLTGVGGEGVLTAQTIIARAANMDGYVARGLQLHGLAQRGGSAPTFVRYGLKGEAFGPEVMQADADLVLAFEPLEAVRVLYYARKEKTAFIINDKQIVPIYSNLMKLPYPSMAQVQKAVRPFAKSIRVFSAHKVAEQELGQAILGNTVLIGAAAGAGELKLRKESLLRAVERSAAREVEANLKAFELGWKLGRKGR